MEMKCSRPSTTQTSFKPGNVAGREDSASHGLLSRPLGVGSQGSAFQIIVGDSPHWPVLLGLVVSQYRFPYGPIILPLCVPFFSTL